MKPKFLINDLRDEVVERSKISHEILLDTADYIPDKYRAKCHKYVFKLTKKQLRKCKWAVWFGEGERA